MIFLGLCTWQDISLTGSGIGIVGILILCEWFLIGGMAFFLSLIAVHFRDMTEIWDMALVVLFYLTPIFYPLTLIPESVRNILWYNPLTQIVVFSRNAIFLQKFPEIHQIVFLLGLSVGIFIIGYVFFHFRIRRSLEKL
jgi:ABC-type polysaccharide/polyol phosphate export permease